MKIFLGKVIPDTETILIANVILGFEKMLEKLEGMFAFALYNKKKNLYI